MAIICYFEENNKRCGNDASFELEYWCSQEHKDVWQEENYKNRKVSKGKRILTVKDIQERLREMASEVRERNKKMELF